MNAPPSVEQLARDICSLAQRGKMPDAYWLVDSRIARACAVLGISPEQARDTDWSTATAVPARTNEPAQPLEVWTDGACRHNPGPGGWGWVTTDGRTGSGAEPGTTNQRMEIRAAYEAVCSVTERPLVVVSDSTYVVNAFNKKWWRGWLQRGWKNSQGQPVANRDLWEPFIDLVVFDGVTVLDNPNRQPVETQVGFRWVKGHAGHALNEAADALAVAARNTLPDTGRRQRRRP